MLHNVLPHGILGGSPAHEEHHNGGKRHYQQFFLYLDYLIGAVEKNEGSSEKGAEKRRPITNGNYFKGAITFLRSFLPVK